MDIQPEKFWDKYQEELMKLTEDHEKAARAYKSDFLWTRIAVPAAESAMTRMGLQTGREYFRLDALGWESHEGIHNWTLRVAFEHENRVDWTDELCKLCHVVADLRVLVFYWDFRPKNGLVAKMLSRCLTNVQNQVQHNRGDWLFVIGPRSKSFAQDHPFVAYKYDGTNLVILPNNDNPINPYIWQPHGQ